MSGGDRSAREPLTGRFWLADEPGRVASGHLDTAAGTLDVEAELISSTVWTKMTSAGGRAMRREDREALYLIVGTLDDGTDVTVPGASRRQDLGIPPWRQHPQHFSFFRCFLGDHVTEETEYETVEIVPDDLWSTWLPGVDVAADVEIAGAGTVTITVRDGRLVAHGSPMTAEQWARRVTDPFCALLMLVSGHGVTVSETVLRRPGEPEVREGGVQRDAPDTRRLDCLIAPSELTPEVLARWFAFVDQTVPVPVVLGQTICPHDRTVEIDVLVLAACAEAIHREVFDELAMSEERAEELRRAALEGLDGDGHRVVADRLNNLTAMTFHARLVSLIGPGLRHSGRSSWSVRCAASVTVRSILRW